MSGHIINNDKDLTDWEDAYDRPWPSPEAGSGERRRWMTSTYAWRPPHSDARIAAQNGGFLFGGVPVSIDENGKRRFWPKNAQNDHWRIDEVRRCVSVAVRPHKLNPVSGRSPEDPLFTLRIQADAKSEIRKRLAEFFGYEHRTIYPDHSGFASFGVSYLKTSP